MSRFLLFSCLLLVVFGCTKESFAPADQVSEVDPNQPTELTITLVEVTYSESGNCEPYSESAVPDAAVRIYAGTSPAGELVATLTTNRYGKAELLRDNKSEDAVHFVSATFPDGTVVERSVATPLHRHSFVRFAH